MNHLDALRLDDEQLDELKDDYVTLRNHAQRRKRELHSPYVPPLPPPVEQQDLLLTTARGMETIGRGGITDWLRMLCYGRRFFSGTIVFASDDSICGTGYKFLYAKQQPLVACLLQVQRVPVVLPCPLSSDWLAADTPGENYAEYTYLPLAFRLDEDLPFGGDSELWVVRDSEFHGDKIVSYAQPVPFDAFVRPFRDVKVKAPRARKPTSGKVFVSAAEELALRAQFPWLTDADFFHSRAHRRARQSEARGHQGTPDADPAADDGQQESSGEESADDEALHEADWTVASSLARLRLDFAAPEDNQWNFALKWLGGNWTYEHHGVVADKVAAAAVGSIASDWCVGYGLQTRYTFSIEHYTREGAVMLARETCRRLEHFISFFIEARDENFLYTEEMLNSYQEDATWQNLVSLWPAASKFHKRAIRLRSIVPENWDEAEEDE